MFTKYWYSLRFRYTISVVVLIVMIFFASFLAYNTISRAHKVTAERISVHQQLSESARFIRVNILDSTTYTDAYLLEPSYTEYRQQALDAISSALAISRKSEQIKYKQLEKQKKLFQPLSQLIEELKSRTQTLFKYRENIGLQYPSMQVGNNVMQPNRDNFNNAIALALTELNDEGKRTSQPGVYDQFILVRHLWTQVLSNFRLYLANRMGSFNVEALPVQENAIATMHKELAKQIEKLAAYDEQGLLGFQAAVAVNDMRTSLARWYEGFKTVRIIHHSEDWRADSSIMKRDIVPLIKEISNLLFEIDNYINDSSEHDMEGMIQATNAQTNILLVGAGGVLLFVLLIFISTNRLVFKPIASVVRALKAEAFGKDGVVLPSVRSEETTVLIDAFNEMSKRVHERQSDLEYQALHDSLTALPNRTLLQERMAHHIQVARRDHCPMTLFMIDLDRFKEVNDTLGHHIGDKVLIEIGLRITAHLREVDTVARLGGDEFAVILPDTDVEQAIEVAKKLLSMMKQNIEVEDIHLHLGMSIGIACYPQHGVDVTTIIQHADVAMYVAKQNQLGLTVYDPSKDDYSIRRLELIDDLNKAIKNDGLSIQYQPVINMVNDELKGVEALLRWQHPSFGKIPPEQVISLAEQTGLINQVTYWMMDKSLQQIEMLQKKGFLLELSINISAFNLKDQKFVERVKSTINKYTVDTSSIVLEITESAMMSNLVHASEVLSELDNMGIKLAIDDFGTGFSSLSYLKQLPVDKLKIDKSFVKGMQDNNSDEVIVHSTIELAHNLGLEVVAEGVESKQIYDKLKNYLCDSAQGYYMSRPLPLDKLEAWMEDFNLSTSTRAV